MTQPAWQRIRSILAFPHGWQHPARTEEWVYERCLTDLQEHRFVQLLCFPWATLIDLQRQGKAERARLYYEALQEVRPKTTLIRATVCQHIDAKDMLPWFKQLKITDLFWSHATSNEMEIDGIRIHPFPLYPVRCADYPEIAATGGKPLHERKYLYSFIGAYDPDLYLSPSRQWIFDLPNRPDAYVERRSEWHYEKQVYGEQIADRMMNPAELQIHQLNSRHYAEVMQDTVFSLCPSGSGPNSIRLWESIGFGCIPVILSDTLRLPGEEHLWAHAAIKIEEMEFAVQAMPDLLEQMFHDGSRLEAMRDEGRKLWARQGLESGTIALESLLAGIHSLTYLTEKRSIHSVTTSPEDSVIPDGIS